MSDPRYSASIIQGCGASRTPGHWPPSLPGLGAMVGAQPLDRCADYPRDEHPMNFTTHVRYGERFLCKRHARGRAAEADRLEVEATIAAKNRAERESA